MPVYEYKCNACGRELEVQQRMSDPELTDCEACGKPALERLISRTAFTLKGGGWYKDLYASTKPESKSSETKTETKTDGASASPGDKGSSTPAAPSSGSGESSSGSGSSGSGSGSSGSGSSGSGGSSGSSGSKAAASAS